MAPTRASPVLDVEGSTSNGAAGLYPLDVRDLAEILEQPPLAIGSGPANLDLPANQLGARLVPENASNKP